MSDDAIILILGAGGHAKVLLDALLADGRPVRGLLDPDASLHGTDLLGKPVLGDERWLESRAPGELSLVNGVGSNGPVVAKRRAFERAKEAGYAFTLVRHPSAIVGRDVVLGEGTQLMARTVVEVGTEIGRNVTINTGAIVNHDCRIADHVHVAPGAVVLGGVRIGEATHVGAGAIILPGLRIGSACVIAAGSVVVADVASGLTVAGVPAAPMDKRP